MLIPEHSRPILGPGGWGSGTDSPNGRGYCNSTEAMGHRNRAHVGEEDKRGESEPRRGQQYSCGSQGVELNSNLDPKSRSKGSPQKPDLNPNLKYLCCLDPELEPNP